MLSVLMKGIKMVEDSFRYRCNDPQTPSLSITVCIPVFNVEGYLRDCLDSIVSQNYEYFDVVLIDDGSTDSSGFICDEYAEKYPHQVTVVHKKNEGPLLARREGFKLANGEYVMCVDSDDMLLPGALSAIARTAEYSNADVIRYGYTRNASDSLSDCPVIVDSMLQMRSKQEMIALLCRSTDGSQNSMCSKAVRRSCVDAGTDYSPFKGLTFCEDFLQTLPVYDLAESFCELDLPLYYYRPGSGITKGYDPHFYGDVCRCLDVGEMYAAKWELEFSCDGLMAGLASCRLDSASWYAEWLAANSDKDEIAHLGQTADFLRCSKAADYSLLRSYRRIVIFSIQHSLVSIIKGISIIHNLKKRLVQSE